jgi:uncharacterized protein YjeT (DUF2065 family)
MSDRGLQQALEGLSEYLLDRTDPGWKRAVVDIEFLADDVLRVSGDHVTQSGASVAFAFDGDVLALCGEIRRVIAELHREPVRGLKLSLDADGSLLAEFTYARPDGD